MNATLPAPLPARQIRLFRVGYSWRRYGRTFSAHTVWGAFSLDHCKTDFARRNPHVISFRVEAEGDFFLPGSIRCSQ